MASTDIAEDAHLISTRVDASSLRQKAVSGLRDISQPLQGFYVYSWAIEVYAVICLTLFLRALLSFLPFSRKLMRRLLLRSHCPRAVRTRCRETRFGPYSAMHRRNGHLRGRTPGHLDKVRNLPG